MLVLPKIARILQHLTTHWYNCNPMVYEERKASSCQNIILISRTDLNALKVLCHVNKLTHSRKKEDMFTCFSYLYRFCWPFLFFPSSLVFFRGLRLLRGAQASVQETGWQHLPRRPGGEKLDTSSFLLELEGYSSVSCKCVCNDAFSNLKKGKVRQHEISENLLYIYILANLKVK